MSGNIVIYDTICNLSLMILIYVTNVVLGLEYTVYFYMFFY